MTPIATLRNVSKVYRLGGEEIYALRNIDLSIHIGEYLALLGPSGSGKSTLMNIIGCLDQPSTGSYCLNGVSVDTLSDYALARIRGEKIGFVFQNFNLIPRLSAMANVERALIYRQVKASERVDIATASLERVGLGNRMRHLPSELSGGQRQRVAIARALCTEPELLIADEPTGNLDSASAKQILSLFEKINQGGTTVVLVTHDKSISDRCERNITLRDGMIYDVCNGSN